MQAPERDERDLVEEEEITEENVFDEADETHGFFPNQVLADLVVSAVLLALIVALSWAIPVPLTEPADFSTTDYVPRPEWFFFFLDQWLIFFPGAVLISFGNVVVPGLFVLLLFAIPWLDREPVYSPAKRPVVVVISFLVILVVVLNLFLALARIAVFTGGTPAG